MPTLTMLIGCIAMDPSQWLLQVTGTFINLCVTDKFCLKCISESRGWIHIAIAVYVDNNYY